MTKPRVSFNVRNSGPISVQIDCGNSDKLHTQLEALISYTKDMAQLLRLLNRDRVVVTCGRCDNEFVTPSTEANVCPRCGVRNETVQV